MDKETKIVFSLVCAYWVFVFLKIFGVVDTSWWIVLLPFWIVFFFIGVAFAIWGVMIVSVMFLGIVFGRKCEGEK